MGLLKFSTFHNCSMLSIGISTYGCTQEVLRAREKRKGCSRRSREQLQLIVNDVSRVELVLQAMK